jgi:hypothetical protein
VRHKDELQTLNLFPPERRDLLFIYFAALSLPLKGKNATIGFYDASRNNELQFDQNYFSSPRPEYGAAKLTATQFVILV